MSVQEFPANPALLSQYYPKNNTHKKKKIQHSSSGRIAVNDPILSNPKPNNSTKNFDMVKKKIQPIQILKQEKKQQQ